MKLKIKRALLPDDWFQFVQLMFQNSSSLRANFDFSLILHLQKHPRLHETFFSIYSKGFEKGRELGALKTNGKVEFLRELGGKTFCFISHLINCSFYSVEAFSISWRQIFQWKMRTCEKNQQLSLYFLHSRQLYWLSGRVNSRSLLIVSSFSSFGWPFFRSLSKEINLSTEILFSFPGKIA